MAEEIPLTGGNVSDGVVRVGDTVRRPATPSTPAVQALLGHLRDAGFPGVPRPLGLDDRGRAVLSFVPGEPVFPDRTAFHGTDDGLAGVGRYVRDLHDVLAGFVPPADAVWRVPIPDVGDHLVVHHDLAPWWANAEHVDAHPQVWRRTLLG
ncbi:hypothetical protein EV383_5405 [Pseudonocardia sediminis]|uniref:Phosphotransferase family enzyme n=1 Tax=Pseudonocardia sediminis TaxID=1397368 RepID=A0A4Q7V6Q2_PSEST|nr:hypothetical protein [Pseudonocardia sediminis]RZT88463.1 hypothetical protein EV383_5405 [Pseudonocardia sediminis]